MSRLGWDCRYTFGAVLATEMKMAARVTHESSLFGARQLADPSDGFRHCLRNCGYQITICGRG